MASFKDIVVNIRAKLNGTSTQLAAQQLQAALNAGTNPKTAKANIAAIDKETNNLIKSVKNLASTLLVAFGGRAIYRFFADSIMMFAKFDQKLQQSVSIMEGVTASMRKEMRESAIGISKAINIAADELAGAYYYLASAGLDAKQSLAALPIVALFAKAGIMELNEATELLTQSNSVLGYQSKDAQKNLAGMVRIADVLTKASMQSQATIDQLAVSLATKAGNSMRLFDKDVEEGVAVLAVFADQGIRGAVAGERLDMFLRQATQAAIKHKEVFKAYGIQIFDTKGKMRNMADIADDLTKALGGLNDKGQVTALQQLGFQVRTVAAAKAFIGEGDAIREYEKSLRSASGYTKHVADNMMKTPIEQWGIFQKKIEAARIELGEKFIGAVTESGKALGNEDDPDSIVGMLRVFSKWLGENQESISSIAKLIVWFATKPLMELFNMFNATGDALVLLINGPFFVLIRTFNVLVDGLEVGTRMMGAFMGYFSKDAGKSIEDVANQIHKFHESVKKFGDDRGLVNANAWARLMPRIENGKLAPSNTKDPFANLSGAGGGRTSGDRSGNALDIDPASVAAERAKRISDLSDRLDKMLAKHTKEHVDDQMAMLNDLVKDYQRVYGDELPAIVVAGFNAIREAIDNEGGAEFFKNQFETYKSLGASQEVIDDFIVRATNMRDTVDESTVAWEKYNDVIIQAIKLSKKMKEDALKDQLKALREDLQHYGPNSDTIGGVKNIIKSLEAQMSTMDKSSDEWREYNDLLASAKELLQDISDKIEQIKKRSGEASNEAADKRFQELLDKVNVVADAVETRLTDAWTNFFKVLSEGSRKGNDAVEMLGRSILSAMLGGIGEYGMKRAKMAWVEAAEQVAHGIKNLSDPLTAPMAAGNFLAAAKFTAVGTMWAALGAGGGMAANSITSYGAHGLASDRGQSDIQRDGSQINIYIDGIDPNNPRHQDLLAQTIAEYQEASGGSIITYKGIRG